MSERLHLRYWRLRTLTSCSCRRDNESCQKIMILNYPHQDTISPSGMGYAFQPSYLSPALSFHQFLRLPFVPSLFLPFSDFNYRRTCFRMWKFLSAVGILRSGVHQYLLQYREQWHETSMFVDTGPKQRFLWQETWKGTTSSRFVVWSTTPGEKYDHHVRTLLLQDSAKNQQVRAHVQYWFLATIVVDRIRRICSWFLAVKRLVGFRARVERIDPRKRASQPINWHRLRGACKQGSLHVTLRCTSGLSTYWENQAKSSITKSALLMLNQNSEMEVDYNTFERCRFAVMGSS